MKRETNSSSSAFTEAQMRDNGQFPESSITRIALLARPGRSLTKRVELRLALGEALDVSGIDEEDNAVNLGEVLAPQATSLHVSTEVVGGEADVADSELLRGGVQGRLEGSETVVLEHVKESLVMSAHSRSKPAVTHAALPWVSRGANLGYLIGADGPAEAEKTICSTMTMTV